MTHGTEYLASLLRFRSGCFANQALQRFGAIGNHGDELAKAKFLRVERGLRAHASPLFPGHRIIVFFATILSFFGISLPKRFRIGLSRAPNWKCSPLSSSRPICRLCRLSKGDFD